MGITDGDTTGAVSSVGIDFDAWTDASGISTANGAVFWMDPMAAPAASTLPGGELVVAQLTVPELVANMQGDSPAIERLGIPAYHCAPRPPALWLAAAPSPTWGLA